VRALMKTGKPDWFSHTDYVWLRDHNQMFSDLAATMTWRDNVDYSGEGQKQRTNLFVVSGNYFRTLGVEPVLGRVLTNDDEIQKHPVAVLSYSCWQRAFGGNRDVLGRILRMDRVNLEIVGVAPPAFHGEFEYGVADYPEFWVPLTLQPDLISPQRSFLNTRNVSWLALIGRLRPGVSFEKAQAGKTQLYEALREDLHVNKSRDYLGGIGIQPGAGGLTAAREQYGDALRLLMALVALVLLIACANVANLLMARAETRRREFAVRLALGAGRGRLVRQLMTESLLLAGLACGCGLWIGEGVVHAFVAMSTIRDLAVPLNPQVFGFAIAISCGAALVFGLAPALQGNRIDPWIALKETRISGGRMGWFAPARMLVVAQTSLSMVLLIASGLLLRTFLNLKAVNPGFDEQTIEANLDRENVSEDGVVLGKRLVEQIRRIPGVQAVSFSRFGPISGSARNCCISVEGYLPAPDEDKNIRIQEVSKGYFQVTGIGMLAGRDFADTDRKGATEVAVVNQTMARHYFGKANPIGRHFSWSTDGPKNVEIIGLVADSKYDNLRQETPRLVYVSAEQRGQGPTAIEIRASSPKVIADCKAAILAVNTRIKIRSIVPLSQKVNDSLSAERLLGWLAAGIGLLALLLTSIGLYGVLAYAVTRRTPEFGVRMAMGAGRSAILKMVLSDGLILVGAGLTAGLIAALFLSTLTASILYGVEARDALTYAAAALVLSVVALGASYGPARRATAIEPVVALRYD
jgi:predicted permease